MTNIEVSLHYLLVIGPNLTYDPCPLGQTPLGGPRLTVPFHQSIPTARLRIYLIAGGISLTSVIIAIFLLFFCCGISQHRQWGALENDVAEAVLEAEEGRRGGRAQSWRCQENEDDWVADFLRRQREEEEVGEDGKVGREERDSDREGEKTSG